MLRKLGDFFHFSIFVKPRPPHPPFSDFWWTIFSPSDTSLIAHDLINGPILMNDGFLESLCFGNWETSFIFQFLSNPDPPTPPFSDFDGYQYLWNLAVTWKLINILLPNLKNMFIGYLPKPTYTLTPPSTPMPPPPPPRGVLEPLGRFWWNLIYITLA